MYQQSPNKSFPKKPMIHPTFNVTPTNGLINNYPNSFRQDNNFQTFQVNNSEIIGPKHFPSSPRMPSKFQSTGLQQNGQVLSRFSNSPFGNPGMNVELLQQLPIFPINGKKTEVESPKIQKKSSIRNDFAIKTESQSFDSARKNIQSPKAVQKEEGGVSWTKYVSMQFKLEEKQKIIRGLNQLIIQKQKKVGELQKMLVDEKGKQQQMIQEFQKEYNNKLEKEKEKLEERITAKNQEIQQILNKVSLSFHETMQKDLKSYISQIFRRNSELQANLISEREKNQILARKLSVLQSQEQQYVDFVKNQSKALEDHSKQLEYITEKVLARNKYQTETQNFVHVVKAQSTQVDILRKSLQSIQKQYLKVRQLSSQNVNKLESLMKNNKTVLQKNFISVNDKISELISKMNVKQNQVSCLKQKLSNTERKLNNITEEHRTKLNNISHLMSRKVYSIQTIEQIKEAISNVSLTNCKNCVEIEEKLTNAEKKIQFLLNRENQS